MRVIRCQRGSVLPLVAVMVVLTFAMLGAAMAAAGLAAERSRQQASADMTALAGAASMAKATEAARSVDFTIWCRNVTLDALYLAATVATIGSAGAGAEAFAVPLKFQRMTIKPVEALERAKSSIEKTAVAHAVVNGSMLTRANGSEDHGLALPVPLSLAGGEKSQRWSDLEKMIQVYDRRLRQAKSELDETLIAYERRKAELSESGANTAVMKRDNELKKLRRQVRERSGRVGGLTTQRNRRQNEMARIKFKQPLGLGRDGIVGVVVHRSTLVGTSLISGATVETGMNLALSGAVVVDGPPQATIGDRQIRELLGPGAVGLMAADGISRLKDAVNLIGYGARDLEHRYGAVGRFVHGAIDKLGIIPPPLNEARPALAPIEKVLPDLKRLKRLISEGRKLGDVVD